MYAPSTLLILGTFLVFIINTRRNVSSFYHIDPKNFYTLSPVREKMRVPLVYYFFIHLSSIEEEIKFLSTLLAKNYTFLSV